MRINVEYIELTSNQWYEFDFMHKCQELVAVVRVNGAFGTMYTGKLVQNTQSGEVEFSPEFDYECWMKGVGGTFTCPSNPILGLPYHAHAAYAIHAGLVGVSQGCVILDTLRFVQLIDCLGTEAYEVRFHNLESLTKDRVRLANEYNELNGTTTLF